MKRKIEALRKQYDDTSTCAMCARNENQRFVLSKYVVTLPTDAEIELLLKETIPQTELGMLLFLASNAGRTFFVDFLLKKGVDPNTTIQNRSCLIEASENGRKSVVELLLKHGADVNFSDEDGNTSLMLSCANGYYDIASLLLKHKASVNARNKQGSTAFLSCCMMGYVKIAKLLLEFGANPLLKNNAGQTALMLSSFYGHTVVVKTLLSETTVDVNSKDSNHDTALIFGAQNDHEKICELLINHGASTKAKNKYLKSAQCYSRRSFKNVAALFKPFCVKLA